MGSFQKILKPTKPRAVDTSTSEQPSGDSVITNGYFITNSSGLGTGWTSGNNSNDTEAISTGNGFPGNAQKVTSGGNGSGGAGNTFIYQTIGVGLENNTTYEFSYYQRSTQGMTVYIVETNETDVHLNKSHSANTGNATKHTWRFTTGNSVGEVYIRFYNRGSAIDSLSGDIIEFGDVTLHTCKSLSNNNHGHIYSGRGLQFDGVSDHLTFDTTGDLEAFTIAQWVKIASFTNLNQLFSGGQAGLYPSIKSSTGNTYWYNGSDWLTGAALELDTWYRLVYVFETNGSGGNYTVYINGVKDIDETGVGTYTTGKFDEFGALNANDRLLNGIASDAQIWNTAWTQSDVTYDYLNPESLALNNSGTSLKESNLLRWFPMQDGHSRGEQTSIMDGANTGLGDELISDISASAWTKGSAGGSLDASTTVTDNADGSVTIETAETSDWQTVSVPFVNENGVTYKISITGEALEETDGDNDDKFYWRVGDSSNDGHDTNNVNTSWMISEGAHTETNYFSSNVSTGTAYFIGMFKKASNTVHKFRLDSVSIKAVNNKHHATTLFTDPTELWDGADNSTSNWDASGTSSVTASADCLKIIPGRSSTGPNIDLRDSKDLTTDLTVGRTYRITAQGATDVTGTSLNIQANTGGTDSNSNAISASNLVTNGNMEADSNWVNSHSPTTNERSTAQVHNGTYSRKFTPDAANEGIASDTFTTVAGDKLLITAWVYPDDGTTVTLRYAEGNGSTNHQTDFTGLTENAWNQVAMQAIDASGGSSARLKINSGTSTSGDWYVDDVVVTKFIDLTLDFRADSATTNELRAVNMHGSDSAVNGNFANSLAAGDADDQWIDDNNGDANSNIDLTRVTTAGRKTSGNDDEPCLKLTLDGTATTGYVSYRKDDYVVGRKYYARCYVNDHTNTGVNTLQLHAGESLGDETDSGVSTAVPNVNFDGSWTLVNLNFTATNKKMYIKFEISADANNDTCHIDDFIIMPQENLWLDDISVKEIGIAAGWTNADQQLDIPQTALQSYSQLAWFLGSGSGEGATLDSAITTGTNNWSMSFWIFKQENYEAFDFFMGTSSTLNFAFDNNSNRKIWYRDTDAAYHSISDADIPDNEWVHIVITAIGNTSMTAYVNGQAQDTDTGMNGTSLYLTRFMTGYATSIYETLGSINEIAYFANRAIGESNIQELYNGGKAYDARNITDSNYLTHYWRNNGLAEWKDLKGSNDINVNSTTTLLLPAGVDLSRDTQGFLMNRQKDTNSLNLYDDATANEDLDSPYVKRKGNAIDDWSAFSISA